MGRRKSLIELVANFWSRVDTNSDCWLWTGELNNQGYGVFRVYERDTCEKLLAHRFSALLAGMPVHSPRDVVMHKCDTPRCVRAAHLAVGTQMDNMRDAKHKNRMNLTGLSARTRRQCRDCGTGFDAQPAEWYCADHKLVNGRPR